MFDKKEILNLIKLGPISSSQLIKKLNIGYENKRRFLNFLEKLQRENEVFLSSEREYFISNDKKRIEADLEIKGAGFAFIDLEEGGSIFLSKVSMGCALSRDNVEVLYVSEPGNDEKYVGYVNKILKANTDSLTGIVKRNKFGLYFQPTSKKINVRFTLINPEKWQENQAVKAKIVDRRRNRIIIKLDKVLGMKDDISVDILTVIEDANVLHEFGDATLNESKKIPDTIDNEPKNNRKDLRNRLIVTIDGDDTKDFDDAIEVRKLDNGNYMLSVHIADVTHYVREGMAIDAEANQRGTSIYLADRVIPMLPESLSNGICSLNPHVDRFTLSADMEINSLGETVNYEIYPSIINSKHRLTYKEVNDFYAGKKTFDPELTAMLNDADGVSKIIRDNKNKEGYIDFEIDEAKIILDETGKPVDVVVRDRGISEMMIEDFMVRANETVAYHFTKNELPSIYRIHASPDPERIVNLQNVVNKLGIKVKIPNDGEPQSFARAVAEIKAARFDDFMKIMMLRTMSKAIYSDDNIGHFGLASKYYTHFTSPIRRYPDLMVHRMLRDYFFEGNKDRAKHYSEQLPGVSSHSSLTEQRAVELERHVADMKKAEYYESKVGEIAEGQIVSVLKFGMFVEFPNKVNGLVHVSTLTGKFELDQSGLSLVSKTDKFTIGEMVNVVVVKADKSEGKIDLVLKEDYENYKKDQARYKKRR